MFNKPKYIITEDGKLIIFGGGIQHSFFRNFNPVSAGFCHIYNNSFAAYGESVSLQIKSSPNDSEIITKKLKDKVVNFLLNENDVPIIFIDEDFNASDLCNNPIVQGKVSFGQTTEIICDVEFNRYDLNDIVGIDQDYYYF